MVDQVKTMVAKGGLQPRCNREPRNYRNHRATTSQQCAIRPQPEQNQGRNRAIPSLRSGAMIAPTLSRLRALRGALARELTRRGIQKFGGQPYEPRPVSTCDTDERHTALRSPYPLKYALPMPRDAEREMPHPRRPQPRRAPGGCQWQV
jgi:hypothetical protein